MDEQQYSSLVAALREVPDPRHARGRRHAWPLILTLISAALLSGQRNVRALGQWVEERTAELSLLLQPSCGRLPSTATLRRALRAVDSEALERRLSAFVQGLPSPAALPVSVPPEVAVPRWVGQAVDGKAVRGANRHGAKVHLVSLVQHGDGLVLGQVRVADKSNEITAAPRLLAGQDLRGTVTTMDALLTQRALAAQIRRQGGHYLLVVKQNQPALYDAIDRLFRQPPPPDGADHTETLTTWDKGHGRLEMRTVTRTAALNDYLDWPDVGQVLRRRYRAVELRTGDVQQDVTYALSSLPAVATTTAEMAALWRGHWTIENRVHYVRDVSMGEDAGQQWTGQMPQALAALRNGLLSLLRSRGWTNIADALRHYGAYAPRALDLLGAMPA